MSADPLVQAPTNTQSFNRYAYVWNNPLSHTDPSGFECEKGGQNTGNCGGPEIDGEGTQTVTVATEAGKATVEVSNNLKTGTAESNSGGGSGGNNSGSSGSNTGSSETKTETSTDLSSLAGEPEVDTSNVEIPTPEVPAGGDSGGAEIMTAAGVVMGSPAPFGSSGLGVDTSNSSVDFGNTTNLASFGLAGADITNTMAMCQSGVCFDQWRGTNSRWYNLGWGGNQWTGPRSMALFHSRSFRLVGRGLGALSVGVEFTELAGAVINRNNFGIADSVIDLAAMAPGFVGGLPGFVFSSSYAVTDSTFGPALSGMIADGACSFSGC